MEGRSRRLALFPAASLVIVVDTSAWVDYFNGTPGPVVERLDLAFREEDDLAVLPVVITEVLQGFRSDAGFESARRILVSLPRIEPDVETHVRAARLYRRLRSRGVTVRGAVDCIIAQACIDAGATLLTTDRDFDAIEKGSELRVWRG